MTTRPPSTSDAWPDRAAAPYGPSALASRYQRLASASRLTNVTERRRGWAWPRCSVVALRSVGPVPGDGSLYCVAVRGGLQVAEGGFELAGVDDEGRADRDRLPGCLSDHVEELLGGERPGRWQMPDLPVCFPAIRENQQPAGDVRQVVEGVRLVKTPGPLRLLSGEDPPEDRLACGRAGSVRAVIVRSSSDRDPRPAVAVRG